MILRPSYEIIQNIVEQLEFHQVHWPEHLAEEFVRVSQFYFIFNKI